MFDKPWLRLLTLVVLAAAGLIAFYAQGIALDSYNAACPPGHRFMTGEPLTGGSPAQTAMFMAKWYLVAILPALLVRRPATIITMVAVSVLILLAALFHFAAAHASPYECVTMGGDYEDGSSGTWEFLFAYLFLVPLSYIVAAVDLLLSTYVGMAAFFRRQ
jgi:hypothetical protein